MTLLLVGAGGFLGAVARRVPDGPDARAPDGGFPWGTPVAGGLITLDPVEHRQVTEGPSR